VALTARGVRLRPCAIALGQRLTASSWPRPGAPLRFAPGRLEGTGLRLAWDWKHPPAGEPAVRSVSHASASALSARGTSVLGACGVLPRAMTPHSVATALPAAGLTVAARAREAVELLLVSAATLDPNRAARAAARLVGRGPGLTPEGDDLLAGAALTVSALADSVDSKAGPAADWLAAVALHCRRERTTPLSHTLLCLALAGRGVEPAHALLDLSPTGAVRWPSALSRLRRIGHSTGPAYAAGIGASALLIGPRMNKRRPAHEPAYANQSRHEGSPL